tara:strand:+ start:136 stop:480 length:345 start_codon:yes stop_codon:yes gene_type:complete
MSTNYEPLKDLSYKKMKKLCTDIEFVKNENSSNKWGEIIHKDGNWLHFYEVNNKVCGFTRYGRNDVEDMIAHIQFKMGVPIYDEYSDEYHELWLSNLTEEERKEYEEEMSDDNS